MSEKCKYDHYIRSLNTVGTDSVTQRNNGVVDGGDTATESSPLKAVDEYGDEGEQHENTLLLQLECMRHENERLQSLVRQLDRKLLRAEKISIRTKATLASLSQERDKLLAANNRMPKLRRALTHSKQQFNQTSSQLSALEAQLCKTQIKLSKAESKRQEFEKHLKICSAQRQRAVALDNTLRRVIEAAAQSDKANSESVAQTIALKRELSHWKSKVFAGKKREKVIKNELDKAYETISSLAEMMGCQYIPGETTVLDGEFQSSTSRLVDAVWAPGSSARSAPPSVVGEVEVEDCEGTTHQDTSEGTTHQDTNVFATPDTLSVINDIEEDCELEMASSTKIAIVGATPGSSDIQNVAVPTNWKDVDIYSECAEHKEAEGIHEKQTETSVNTCPSSSPTDHEFASSPKRSSYPRSFDYVLAENSNSEKTESQASISFHDDGLAHLVLDQSMTKLESISSNSSDDEYQDRDDQTIEEGKDESDKLWEHEKSSLSKRYESEKLQCLRNLPLIGSLHNTDLHKYAKIVQVRVLKASDQVFMADTTFCLVSGGPLVVCKSQFDGPKIVSQVHLWEHADTLLGTTTAACQITAVENSVVFLISKEQFRYVLLQQSELAVKEMSSQLKDSPMETSVCGGPPISISQSLDNAIEREL